MYPSHPLTAYPHSIHAINTAVVTLGTETITTESIEATDLGYLEDRRCPGFEDWRLLCTNKVEPADIFCRSCLAAERAFAAEADAEIFEENRRRAGLFTDEEKFILKESLSEDECWAFDQTCSLAEFREGLTVLLRSHVNFLLAEHAESPELIDCASMVWVWRGRRFIMVRDLLEECTAPRAGGLVYEAWAWETARRVRTLIRELDPTPARAMMLCAKRAGLHDVNLGDALDALMDAHRSLYGDPWK